MASSKSPPFYILFSHSSLSPAPSNTFGHPSVQYHYTDDSPLNLIPQTQEHVLLLDYTPDSSPPPALRSISKSIAVTNVDVKEPLVASGVEGRNEKMYIIETTSLDDDDKRSDTDMSSKSPREIISDFKHKNTVLRRVLHYPETIPHRQIPVPNASSALSPTSPLPLSPSL